MIGRSACGRGSRGGGRSGAGSAGGEGTTVVAVGHGEAAGTRGRRWVLRNGRNVDAILIRLVVVPPVVASVRRLLGLGPLFALDPVDVCLERRSLLGRDCG